MDEKEIVKKIFGKDAKIIRPIHGGMMNKIYLVLFNDKKYILSIPTKEAQKLVNREDEKKLIEAASRVNATSPLFYFDTKSGIKAKEYVEGDSLNNLKDFDLNKISILLKNIHENCSPSENDYKPFERFINKYEKEAEDIKKHTDEDYLKIRELLFKNREYLESQKKVFCHNDVHRGNLLKNNNDEYFLTDFEFGGNNDPIYDIATFGNEKVEDGENLLNAYFNSSPSFDEKKRFYLWRMFISLQWMNVAIVKDYLKEGERLNIDFAFLVKHFLNNAKNAYDKYQLLVKENSKDDREKLIIATLDKIRHFLQKDGGDCEFIAFKNGTVYVKMHGACQDCVYANDDIKNLVEVLLQEEVPGVIKVELANEENISDITK